MKILFIADIESPGLYDFYSPGKLDGYDLIVSCGDLSREYLEFLVTMARCPLLYVHGNHDETFTEHPPEGCICIEDRVFTYGGLRFLGLGGSHRYRPDATYMYTENEMRFRVLRMWLRLKRLGGFDVLVSHAPAYGLGDLDTIPHRGFQCFRDLLKKYSPRLMVHGHVHGNYGRKLQRERTYHGTRIVNAFERICIEIDPENENTRREETWEEQQKNCAE